MLQIKSLAGAPGSFKKDSSRRWREKVRRYHSDGLFRHKVGR